MEEIKIADLVFKAHRFSSKKVRKCTPTSGAIYLHKSLIGKVFDVILIPKESDEEEIKKLEDDLQKIKEL